MGGESAARPVGHGLILASGSPRRRALLGRLGLPFVVLPSDLDETVEEGLGPEEVARQLAVAKARAVAESHPDGVVIGADTVVALADPPRLLGKPGDDDEAAEMLRALRNRWHAVSTGVAVVRGGRVWHDVVTAGVRMGDYSDEAIAQYVATGEPRDKAGAYGFQELGRVLVAEVRGSELTVVGLPLRRLAELLIEAGVALPVTPDEVGDVW
ncbi:MAG: nucleoside triphosphate pyrophosphatase [Chloroflexia bacterium]